jgi:hypothetical protein
MRKTAFILVALAIAIWVPLRMLKAQEDKGAGQKATEAKSSAPVQVQVKAGDGEQESKKEKKVEVRVLKVDGKDDDKGNVKVRVLNSDDSEPGKKETYLGVALEPVPPALVAQLPDVLSKEQGMLVAEVMPDSPAAKAGLKQFDVLVSYDDQKLFSPEQLTKLVRGDKPGRDVVLGIVRVGKLEKVKATLAEHEARKVMRLFGPKDMEKRVEELKGLLDSQGPPQKGRRLLELKKELDSKPAPGGKSGGANVRSNFSSMTLRTTDGDRLKAEIEYKDEKGESKKWSFEGTRDEIRKELEADHEMPKNIRDQMLQSLDGPSVKGGRAFRLNFPHGSGGIFIDRDLDDLKGFGFDLDELKGFSFPLDKSIDKILDRLPEDLDPQVRDQIKGTLKSIEPSGKKPIVRERSL